MARRRWSRRRERPRLTINWPAKTASVRCDVDLGSRTPNWLPATGLALTVLENNLKFLPDGAGISVSDGLALDLPIGNLKLADANIDLKMGENGVVDSFRGTAQLPTPNLGIFTRASLKNPMATTVGYDYAREMPQVGVTLDPERKYLFFDLAAGTELEATVAGDTEGSLWLSIPEGQRATVVIDPAERFAFIDGNVTMRYSGSMAFLAGMMDGVEVADFLSGDLPLRHEATVHVSGVLSDDLADSRLELEGRYAVDGGKLAEWLNVTGEPLALEGGLVISDAGLLGTGIVRSSVMPENVWNSAVQGQVFVPFSTDLSQAYAALNTKVDLPFADMTADGYARLDGALDVVADGSFDAPWRGRGGDAIAAAEEHAGETVAREPGRLTRAWEATTAGRETGFEAASRPAGAAATWVRNTAESGYDSASGGLGWSKDLASSKWCSTTGLCGLDDVTEDGTATAMR